jgi:putative (di)nucleoside polyphosphate hydrolase
MSKQLIKKNRNKAVVIDKDGYRLNVGIILINSLGKLFWGKRVGSVNAWQFPQGGMLPYETLEETMYRELDEEVGLSLNDVEIVAVTRRWLSYKLPTYMRRYSQVPLCVGQKQKWFLLRLVSPENCICLNKRGHPEFDAWQWVDYWYPVDNVIFFKKHIYKSVLGELEDAFRREFL